MAVHYLEKDIRDFLCLHWQFHKKYQALNKVRFGLDQGFTLGIIGKSGSGKSTLLKIITGVLLPDKGKCRVQGKVTGLLELCTGFNPEFSGIQNIFFNGSYLGLSKPQIKERLEEIIAFSELEDFIRNRSRPIPHTDLFFIGLSRLEPEVKITDPQGEKI